MYSVENREKSDLTQTFKILKLLAEVEGQYGALFHLREMKH